MGENAKKPAADRIELKAKYKISGNISSSVRKSADYIEQTSLHSLKI
jgi:hypothetical protein